MTRRTLASSTLLTLLLGTAACGPTAVRGGPGTDNPELDERALSTGLDRRDLQDMARENLTRLFGSTAWARWKNAPEPPVIAIWPVKNDTSEHLDSEMLTLLSDIETEMLSSGVVSIVSRERQHELVEEVNVQQGNAFDPATRAQISRQVGAKYYVTGKLQAVDERMADTRRVQYTLFLQVLEVETGLTLFQAKSERTKALVR